MRQRETERDRKRQKETERDRKRLNETERLREEKGDKGRKRVIKRKREMRDTCGQLWRCSRRAL